MHLDFWNSAINFTNIYALKVHRHFSNHRDFCIGLLFDETLYKEKLIPLLINIFHVRDMQIRLVLLKFFPNYVDMVRTYVQGGT